MLLKEIQEETKNKFVVSQRMEKVLVLVFSNLKHDARVMRQVEWLSKKYQVTVVCFDADERSGVIFHKIRQTQLSPLRKLLLATLLSLKYYRLAYQVFHDYGFLLHDLADQQFTFVVANDIDTLPLDFQLKKDAKVGLRHSR